MTSFRAFLVEKTDDGGRPRFTRSIVERDTDGLPEGGTAD